MVNVDCRDAKGNHKGKIQKFDKTSLSVKDVMMWNRIRIR